MLHNYLKDMRNTYMKVKLYYLNKLYFFYTGQEETKMVSTLKLNGRIIFQLVGFYQQNCMTLESIELIWTYQLMWKHFFVISICISFLLYSQFSMREKTQLNMLFVPFYKLHFLESHISCWTKCHIFFFIRHVKNKYIFHFYYIVLFNIVYIVFYKLCWIKFHYKLIWHNSVIVFNWTHEE